MSKKVFIRLNKSEFANKLLAIFARSFFSLEVVRTDDCEVSIYWGSHEIVRVQIVNKYLCSELFPPLPPPPKPVKKNGEDNGKMGQGG